MLNANPRFIKWFPAGRRLPSALGVLAVVAIATAAILWPLSPDLAQARGDDERPKITAGPTITSKPKSGETYGAREAVTVAFSFSEPVTMTGNPGVRVKVGSKQRWAKYDRSNKRGTRLFFTYKVKSNDQDDDGVSVGKNMLKMKGGSVVDADGNQARLKHPALPDQAKHKVHGSPANSSAAPAPQTVAADWSLKPDDVASGESFRLLFVTSTMRDGSSADIADYNAFVQARAATNANLKNRDGASFSNQFRALVSTAAVAARDNTATTGNGVPIYFLNGVKVADDYADFYDQVWDEIDTSDARMESGAVVSNDLLRRRALMPLTGSAVDGGVDHLYPAGHERWIRVGMIVDENPEGADTPGNPNRPFHNLKAPRTADLPLYALSPVLTVQ